MMDKDLAEIIKLLLERQQILTRLVIHWGCRADLYDNFVAEQFKKLEEWGFKSQRLNLINTDTFKEMQ